jgi:quercetin dioxygenase-like cupin family protein
MARAGVRTTNPVSGERITWEQTSEETDGARTVLRMRVAPGGGVRQRHIHPRSSERFTVIKGTIVVELDGTEYVRHAGQSIDCPAGIAHAWWNGGEAELEATVEITPSGRFEEYLELGFRWAREGRLNSSGRLDLLRGAAFADAYREDIVYTSPRGSFSVCWSDLAHGWPAAASRTSHAGPRPRWRHETAPRSERRLTTLRRKQVGTHRLGHVPRRALAVGRPDGS